MRSAHLQPRPPSQRTTELNMSRDGPERPPAERGEMQLFEPIDIGGVTLRNRVMMAVHGPRLSQARYLRYLDERSRDIGLVGLHAFHGVMNFPFAQGPFIASFAA